MPLYIMPEEFDLEQLDTDIEKENKVEKRIKDLSEKVRLTSEERDELKKLSDEKDTKLNEATRERDFFKGFSTVVSKHPAASEHQDDILAKVKSGYSVEDATYAVLGAAGKLGGTQQPIVDNPAGGSAVTQHPSSEKGVGELSRDEKRAKLLEAEQRGDIQMS